MNKRTAKKIIGGEYKMDTEDFPHYVFIRREIKGKAPNPEFVYISKNDIKTLALIKLGLIKDMEDLKLRAELIK